METLDSIESYSELLGIDDFRMTEHGIEVHLGTAKRHANMGGWVHGGVLTGLLDFALGAAVVATLHEGEWCATQSLTTDFLRPGKPGERPLAPRRAHQRGSPPQFPPAAIHHKHAHVVRPAPALGATSLAPVEPNIARADVTLDADTLAAIDAVHARHSIPAP